MIRSVKFNDNTIEYELQRKRVKNINLRVKSDGSVVVSANNRVSAQYIDSFVESKGEFILKALNGFNKEAATPQYSSGEFNELIISLFEKTYNDFVQFNIERPKLKFRKMKSRWGSCNYVDCVITLSTNLIYCSEEQIYYVIVHEFSHLLVHNHSKDFYAIVEQFCPDYKRIRKEMNKIKY